MIITLEHDGQPCLDSNSEKKLSLDIVLPQLSYYPERHPVLGNIKYGYAASISSASDARSEVASESYPTDLDTTPRRKRWRLFNSPLLFKKQPPGDPLLSESTMVEKPRQARKRRSMPLSCAQLSRKWLVGWALLSALLCFVVALSVWLAARRAYHGMPFRPMNSEWSPKDSSIYTDPPELFDCYNDPSNSVPNVSYISIQLLQGQHTFTIQGGASGHLTLTNSPDPNSLAISYDISIQCSPSSLKKVSFYQPPPGPDPSGPAPPGSALPTDFLIDIPITMDQHGPTDPSPCIRFDITMYIPRSLRQLTVDVSTPVQITFSPQAHIELDSLSLSIKNSHPRNRIDSSESVQARSLSIEMNTGLIHGLISLGETSKITNLNGQIQLDTIPNASMDIFNPTKALLETTCFGNVDIRYLRNKAYRKRPIESWHTMGNQNKSTGRFDYGCSGFDGLLYSNSTHYNFTDPNTWKTKRLDTYEEGPWPILIGNRTGGDTIYIRSGSGSIVLPDSLHILI